VVAFRAAQESVGNVAYNSVIYSQKELIGAPRYAENSRLIEHRTTQNYTSVFKSNMVLGFPVPRNLIGS
jgi:hypothetical protein